jgi:CHASE3 domain sensor protein
MNINSKIILLLCFVLGWLLMIHIINRDTYIKSIQSDNEPRYDVNVSYEKKSSIQLCMYDTIYITNSYRLLMQWDKENITHKDIIHHQHDCYQHVD